MERTLIFILPFLIKNYNDFFYTNQDSFPTKILYFCKSLKFYFLNKIKAYQIIAVFLFKKTTYEPHFYLNNGNHRDISR